MAILLSKRTVVLFDLYGTLVLTHEHETAWAAWQDFLIDFISARGGKAKADTAAGLLEGFWSEEYDPQKKRSSLFESRLELFSNKLSLEFHSGEIEKLADDLCDIWQKALKIDPDAYMVLPQLSGQTGLVTNFDHPPHIHRLLQSSGMGEFFKIAVVSAEEGTKKPDPEILQIACRRMGCEPADAIYVGDSIVDFEAAAGAGLAPVIIRRDGQREIENTRDSHAQSTDIESIIAEKEKAGELLMIKSLREVPPLLAK
jgi:putative hydrolase of the HAD superfamily